MIGVKSKRITRSITQEMENEDDFLNNQHWELSSNENQIESITQWPWIFLMRSLGAQSQLLKLWIRTERNKMNDIVEKETLKKEFAKFIFGTNERILEDEELKEMLFPLSEGMEIKLCCFFDEILAHDCSQSFVEHVSILLDMLHKLQEFNFMSEGIKQISRIKVKKKKHKIQKIEESLAQLKRTIQMDNKELEFQNTNNANRIDLTQRKIESKQFSSGELRINACHPNEFHCTKTLPSKALRRLKRKSEEKAEKYGTCNHDDKEIEMIEEVPCKRSRKEMMKEESAFEANNDAKLSERQGRSQTVTERNKKVKTIEDPNEIKRKNEQKKKRVFWTEAEDKALRKGVERHGMQWAMIVKDEEFEWHRTPMQLKDRYRILVKRQDIEKEILKEKEEKMEEVEKVEMVEKVEKAEKEDEKRGKVEKEEEDEEKVKEVKKCKRKRII